MTKNISFPVVVTLLVTAIFLLHSQFLSAKNLERNNNNPINLSNSNASRSISNLVDSKCGTQAALNAFCQGIRFERPPQGTKFIISPHFIVHFDTAGPNRIARAYAESTSVYAEHSWAVQIDTLGWAPPPPDENIGGDSTYDLYILDTNSYGITTTEDDFPNPYPDGATSFIIIDTGMSWDYLRGTVAHEFSHASQFRYSSVDEAWWGENTSTWMEKICYYDINSYTEYLEEDTSTLNMPNLPINDTTANYEYSAGIWPMFLAEYYNINCPRRCWELMGMREGDNTLTGIDSTLRNFYLSDLATALKKYAIWRYFTGSDRGDGLYHFSESSSWPASRILRTHNTYPASGNQGSYPTSGPGGTSFIEFTSATDILNQSFNGQNGYNWSASAIGFRQLHPSIEKEIGLDQNGYGATYLPTVNNNRLALVTVVTQWDEPANNLNYTYQADAQTIGQDWVRSYNGPGNSNDYAVAIASDGFGNIYVTGTSPSQFGFPYKNDFLTIKYNSAGEKLWESRYDGPEDGIDIPTAMAVDALGNVYVTGYSWDATATVQDYTTLKYNSNGQEQWVRGYNGPAGLKDAALGIVVDDSGNVYVTGQSQNASEYFDCVTIKYDSDGGEQWTQRYNSPANQDDIGYSIGIDNRRNIYITGYCQISANNYDYLTIKYNSAGNEQWVRNYNGPANKIDYATSLQVNNQGNVFITGLSDSTGIGGGIFDILTIKYDSAGNMQWKRRRIGPAYSNTLIKINDQGNAFVSGSVFTSNYDIAAIKYNPDGEELWSRTFNFSGNGPDYATGMVLDELDNVYVCAYLDQPGHQDYGVVKFDTAGTDLWAGRYNGPVNWADSPGGITVDWIGNVYVTGRSYVTDSFSDYATVRFVVPTNQPQISSRPRNFSLILHQNQIQDTILKVFNEGTAGMTWILEENPDVEWISENPTYDSLDPGFWTDVTVRFNTTGLAPGTYYTNFVLMNNDPNNRELKVSVEITVLFGTGVSDNSNLPNKPKTFVLENNLPNPFNAQALISYAVPKKSQVKLAIYNCSGMLVRTVHADVDKPGYYQVIWNGRNEQGKPVAKGVYFYRMKADNFTATKKMLKIE